MYFGYRIPPLWIQNIIIMVVRSCDGCPLARQCGNNAWACSECARKLQLQLNDQHFSSLPKQALSRRSRCLRKTPHRASPTVSQARHACVKKERFHRAPSLAFPAGQKGASTSTCGPVGVGGALLPRATMPAAASHIRASHNPACHHLIGACTHCSFAREGQAGQSAAMLCCGAN